MLQPNSSVSYLTITECSGAGQRIDNYLVRKLNNIPKSKIYNILRTGEVRVNKGRIKPSYKLQIDDVVRVPPLSMQPVASPQIPTQANTILDLTNDVIYEDKNLLVVNKPVGLAVHGGSGLKFGLIELLRNTFKNQSLELIHRIDRETSGCVMIAKNLSMLRAMHSLFRTNNIQKTYHVLVKGFAQDKFTVQQPLRKSILISGERMVCVHPEGSFAHTDFITLNHFKGVTLLEAKPITGRTHQIRVHCQNKGVPIIGDQKYGDKDSNKFMATKGLKRLFLHAYELSFTCPLTGIPIDVQAQYDTQWNKAIQILSKEYDDA